MNRKSVFAATLRTTCLCALATFALADVARAAELYKWVDDKGGVHYSDTPPPSGTKKAERVRVDGSVSGDLDSEAAAAAAAAAAKEKEKNPPKTEAPPPPLPPPPLADNPENRARLCDQSNATIELLQSKFQVADSTGKPLDQQARADRLASERQTAAKYCSPQP
jgi:hypothetical protein